MKNKTGTKSVNKKQIKTVKKTKTPPFQKTSLLKKNKETVNKKTGLKSSAALKKRLPVSGDIKEAEKLRHIINNIHDGYYEVDLKGKFTFFNEAVCRVLGYSKEELTGMNHRQFTDKKTAARVSLVCNKVYKTGNPLEELDWQITRKDGAIRYIQGSVSLLKDPSGKPAGFRCIARDITERKLMEDKLRQEEQRFRDLVEYSSDIIVSTDLTGTITYINPAIERVLGYKPEERIGRRGFELIHPDDSKFLADSFVALISDANPRVLNGEMRLRHKNGTYRMMDAVGSNLINNNVVEGIVVNYRDITERKQAEEKLKKSQENYKKLFEDHAAVKFILDPYTGMILDANYAAVQYYGWTREEMKRMTIYQINTASEEDVKNVLGEILRDKKLHFEFVHRHADGSVTDVEVYSSRIEMDGKDVLHSIIHDITERKKAENSLKQAELKFRTIFDSASDGILIAQKGDRKFLAANKKICVMLGYSLEELLKLDVSRIHPEESMSCVIEMFEELLRGEISVANDMPVIRKDKSIFFVDISASKITLDGKECLLGMFRDITERKQVELALMESEEKYRLLADQSIMGIFIIQNGILKYVNYATSKINGYSIEEMLNWKKDEYGIVLHPDDKSYVMRQVDKKQTGDPNIVVSYAWRIVTKSGVIKWVESFSRTISYEGSPADFVMMIDITERKKATEALQKSEAQYRALFENAIEGIFQTTIDGQAILFNPAMLRMLGYDEKTTSADDMNDIASQIYVDSGERKRVIETVIREGRFIGHEVQFKRLDGNLIWVQLNATLVRDEKRKPLYVEGTCVDITARKTAQEELERSKETFLKAFRSSPAMMTISSLEDGRMVEVNDRFPQIMGYTREEAAGKTTIELGIIDPDQRQLILGEILKHGSIHNMELKFRVRSGDLHYGLMSGEIIYLQGKAHLLLMNYDVTELKNASEALQKSEERYRTFFKTSRDCVFISTLEGNWIDMNDSAVDFFGYSSKNELMAVKITNLYKNPEDRKKHLNTVIERGYIKDYSVDLLKKDGAVIHTLITSTVQCDDKGNVKGLMGTIKDITERKRAEEAIRKSEANLKYAQSCAHMGSWERHPTGEGDFWSDEMFRIFEFDAALGPPPFTEYLKKIHPEDRQHVADKFAKSFAEHIPYRSEYRIVRSDGSIRFIEGRGEPILDKDGNVMFVSGTAYDITERKKAEDEIRQLNESLEQRVRERTTELEAFSYSVSHDLRAPLRSIDGFSQALLEDYESKLDEQGKDYLTRIRTSTRLMAELIEDLLKLSRVTRSEMDIVPVNLSRMARTILDGLMESQPQRLVNIKIAESLEDYADPRLIRIVLENLLGNAWKFSGKKTIAEIEFNSMKKDDKKVYYIRDNGAGFDMEYAEKLFAPFQRLHSIEEYSGTGIGLATVKRIISRHGGTVWAEGEPGHGSTFYFILHE